MRCLALKSFAGITYSAAKGKEIDLPMHEAVSLAHSGVVKILGDYKPAIAYEIPEKEIKQNRIIKPRR